MSIKILTKSGTEVTAIDDARANNFDAGNRSGIVKGALNEGTLFMPASNIIAIESCELRIAGHRIIIDSAESITLLNKPNSATRYSLIAEVVVSDLSVPSFRLFIQPATNELIKENLYKTLNGNGTYQLKIGNFTLRPDGTISDIVRVVDIISGGTSGGLSDIVFKATAETISSGLDPEVNVDYNEETGEYDMHFALPSSNTVNSVNGKTGDVNLTAEDVKSLPDTTNYGASIDLSIDSSTYVVTAQLKDQNGNDLGVAKTIDLPLESVVVSGKYDASTKKVILTLQNDTEVSFSVADLVSGLASSDDLLLYLPLSGGTVTGDVTFNKDIIVKGNIMVPSVTHETSNPVRIATITSGGHIRYRTPAEIKSDLGISDTSDFVTKTELNAKGYATQTELKAINSNVSTAQQTANNANNSAATALDFINNDLFNTIYPVGSIYLTVATTTTGSASPARFFGGTWERLPAGYALWTATSGAGGKISAGLPNITGSLSDSFVAGISSNTAGSALYSTSHSKAFAGSDWSTSRLYFDASRSNSIYGASSTVQPPAYKVYAWRRTG